MDWTGIAGVIAAVLAAAISLASLIFNKKLGKKNQQVSILTQKRSQRVDDMRRLCAKIITLARTIEFKKFKNTEQEKIALIGAVSDFIVLLQYIPKYTYDVELINLAISIQNVYVFNGKKLDEDLIDIFWDKCDLYIGTEYERLKLEIDGVFQRGGDVTKEGDIFTQLYKVMLAKKSGVKENAKVANNDKVTL